MAGEIARRPAPTSAEVEQITSKYEPLRVAGVWNMRPATPPRHIFPFLALSQSRAHVPLKSMPLFRYDAGTTGDRSAYPLPSIEAEDTYSDLAEAGLVQIVGRFRKKAQVWIPRRVAPLAIDPPILEALDVFLGEAGVGWSSKTLTETSINKDFVTLKAPVPPDTVAMELGGPTQQVKASALIAAGLRLAVAETLGLQDFRDYQAAHPEQFAPIVDT